MDTTRDMLYRSYKVNDAAIVANIVPGSTIGSGIHGCVVHTLDISDVDVVQSLEKRSEQDGMDAGPVFLGARRIRLSGTLYERTRALLFDELWNLRAAFNPVLAMRESPGDKGYRPFIFGVPTNRTSDYPLGAIDLQVLAMPRAFSAVLSDEAQGGADSNSLAISWQATLICKDPSITGEVPQDIIFTPGSTEITGTTGTASTDLFTKTAHALVANDRIRFGTLTGGAGLATNTDYYVIASGLTANNFKLSLIQGGGAVDFTTDVTVSTWTKTKTFTGNTINRGTYIAPLNMLIEIGPRAGLISVQAGDSVYSLVIPASSGQRIVRFNTGGGKLLTIEEGGIEVPNQSVVVFAARETWPMIQAGTAAYTITFAGLGYFNPTSHMWFWEAYA